MAGTTLREMLCGFVVRYFLFCVNVSFYEATFSSHGFEILMNSAVGEGAPFGYGLDGMGIL